MAEVELSGRRLMESVQAIQGLLGRSDIPPVAGIRIGLGAGCVERETQLITKAVRKIAEEHAKKDKKGKPLVKDGNYVWNGNEGPEEVKKVEEALLTIQVKPVPVSLLGKACIPPGCFMLLDWLFVDDTDDEEDSGEAHA